MPKISHILFVFLGCLTACNKFEYSPYQSETQKDMPGEVNAANLKKILAPSETADDTVTFIYSGDSQRFYEGLERLVKKVNTIPNVDFFVLAGDIADFGALEEYLWVYERLNKLGVPYLCAVGNHDLASNGGKAYTRMFGEKNFSFTYHGYKFLFHDTNGREYNFNGNVPNLPWLRDQLKDTLTEWFIGVSHVPPYDVDFDKNLEYPYRNLFASAPGFLLSLHGHRHETTDTYYDGVRYMTSNSVEKSEVVLLKLINGRIFKSMITI